MENHQTDQLSRRLFSRLNSKFHQLGVFHGVDGLVYGSFLLGIACRTNDSFGFYHGHGGLPLLARFLPTGGMGYLFHTINKRKRKAPAAGWTTGARSEWGGMEVYGICIPNV